MSAPPTEKMNETQPELKVDPIEDHIKNLISIYTPYLYFHKNETCFPIPIETYLKECELRVNTGINTTSTDPDFNNSTLVDSNPTPENLYHIGFPIENEPTSTYFLNFKTQDWKSKLMGERTTHTTYVGVNVDDAVLHNYTLIYTYLYSHTEPYQVFNCLWPLNSYAHRGDVKFNVVYVRNNTIAGMYFGAHGTKGGQYKSADELTFIEGHPVAFPCRGDHSNYYNLGIHPRIFGVVYDITGDAYLSKPQVIKIYDRSDPHFDIGTMGWLYYYGKMSPDGVNAPGNQWYWDLEFDIVNSNNSFKRLCLPSYF